MTIYTFKGQVNIIGERLRQRRKELKISQKNLSAQLQVEGVMLLQKSISRIETGDRVVTDYEVLTLAKVLKVDVMWLLAGEES